MEDGLAKKGVFIPLTFLYSFLQFFRVFFFSVNELVVFPYFGFSVFDFAFWYSFFGVVKFTVIRKKNGN